MKEMKNVFKRNGIKTFYTGLPMQAAGEIPSYASYFYSYELIKRKGVFINEMEVSQTKKDWLNILWNAYAGACAGAISTVVFIP